MYRHQSGELLDNLSKFLVGLTWVDVPTDAKLSTEERRWQGEVPIVSCSLLKVKNRYMLLTAGHVLRDIQSRLKSTRKALKWQLLDYAAANNPKLAIPCHLDPEKFVYLDERGYDYGLICLDNIAVENLLKGPVLPICREVSRPCEFDNEDELYLIGYPTAVIKKRIVHQSDQSCMKLGLGVPLLPVEVCSDPPQVLRHDCERLYGRVSKAPGKLENEDIVLEDIDGLSGGLLFVVRATNPTELKYWVVAIQSSWERSSRTIAACPIDPFLAFLSELLEDEEEKGV